MSHTEAAFPPHVRWVQLGLGLIAMMAISSPQYVWTLFVKPFQTATGGTLPAIQITFSLMIVLQTWLSPVQGWLIERFGARFLITFGCILSGLGWVLSAPATTVMGLWLTYGLFCGVGTGIVYVGIVGLMLKWFPDRRGLATGVVAAGYGFGAIGTTFPIDAMMKASGYQHTLIVVGFVLGAIGALAGLFMRQPPERSVGQVVVSGVPAKEMLKTPVFWLLFGMMTMMSTGGLMVISQFAPVMRSFGIADVAILGMAALPFALTLDRITNGLTRPFFGWVSDRIGREHTMLIAFSLEAVAVLALLSVRDNALLFALMSGVVFFGWGGDFFAVPLDIDGYVRGEGRDDEIRVSVYGAGDRVGFGRSGGGGVARRDRQLDAGVLHHHRDGCRHRRTGDFRVEADAAAVFGSVIATASRWPARRKSCSADGASHSASGRGLGPCVVRIRARSGGRGS